MKKIFTLFGVAALATCLFTACGDDEEEGLADNTYRIEKATTVWDAASVEAYDYTQEEEPYITLNCGNEAGNVTVSGWLQCVAGTYNAQTSNGDYMRYRDENDLVNGNIYNFYPNTDSWSETISAIDLTALTLSGNWSEEYTDYATALANYDQENHVVHFENMDASDINTLKGTMKNIHWNEWATPAKADNSKKACTFDKK